MAKNLYSQATKGFQNVGSQIRKNLKAGQTGPNARKANTTINPLKGTGKAFVGSFKKGGTVKKTGFAKVHKGEKVLTKKQAKKSKKTKK